MKLTILSVGKLKEKYWRDAAAEYVKRLGAYCRPALAEVSDEKAPESLSAAGERIVTEKEGTRLLSHITDRDFVIALDLRGKELNSESLAELLERRMQSGTDSFVFVIGGSLGLSEQVLARANFNLCASKLTFPHQLMRVILLEQIYRSFKIIRGEPYHK